MTRLIFIIALVAGCAATVDASAQSERRFIRSGNRSYRSGDYDKAGEYYMKALDKDKASTEAISNMGNVLYRQENFEGAEQIFSRMAQSEADTSLRSADYYNLGNALFKERRFEEALEAYKEALRLEPGDVDAKFNLAYTRKMLEKDNDENNGGGGGSNDNGDDNKENGDNGDDRNDNDNSGSDDKRDDSDDRQSGDGRDDAGGAMSRQEAERLLDLMQAEENRTSEKVDRDKAKAVGVRGVKNW